MLDTIKLGIPLTLPQHRRIKSLVDEDGAWQWVLLNPSNGELLFRRVKGLANTDGESFHRQLRWDIPYEYIEGDCNLTIELSVPKFWYGHNIHLLYDFATPLEHLRGLLNQQFGLKGRGQLIHSTDWHVSRADFCYAWKFPSQQIAKQFLNSLKRLHFPRKRPIIYDDSILFAGKTYSVKIYLKLSEFKAHDRKELLKENAPLEWVNCLESKADGVLRFEVTARQQYLKRQGIKTVKDLIEQDTYIEWQDEHPHYPIATASGLIIDRESQGEKLRDGTVLKMPSVQVGYFDDEGLHQIYRFPSSNITVRKYDRPFQSLKFLLAKFVGENAGMQRADEIEAKLLKTYKPVKAARLVSFWLYVQKFGSAKAKEIFGDRSYYYTKSELKKAGVSLIEPPSGNNVTVLERDFIQSFRMEIPSQAVTNKVDDFRDSGNVLNLFSQQETDAS